MSLENIQLPDFILADLYKDCLVQLENLQGESGQKSLVVNEKVPQEKVEEPTCKLKYLGQNNKHVVVLVNDPVAAFISESELDFLSKILAACHLNLADIAIVNIHQQKVNYEVIKDQLKASYFLLLGVSPAEVLLPFNIPQFQVQQYAGSTFIYSPSLLTMLATTEDSRLLKSKLWLSLKSAFKL